MPRKSGFTLIEVLVVVAIVVILAGILFPIIAKARENARRTTCISNQRQISMAALIYAQEHEDRMPAADVFWSAVGFDPGTLNCPTLGQNQPGYVYCIYLSGKNLNQITYPSKAFLCMDGKQNSGVEVDATAPYAPNSITEPPCSGVYYIPTDVELRHNKRYVAAFQDGHAIVTNELPPTDMTWASQTNTTAEFPAYKNTDQHIGSALYVTDLTAAAGWHATAKSERPLESNGSVSFHFANMSSHVVIGLGTVSCASASALTCAIYGKSGALRFVENSNMDLAPADSKDNMYSPTDEFTIERNGPSFNYRKRGTIIRTFKVNGTPGPLHVYAWFTVPTGDTDVPGVTGVSATGMQW